MKKPLKRILRNRLSRLFGWQIAEANNCIRAGTRFVCWNHIPGDYLEFGCHSGRTFCNAYQTFHETRALVADSIEPEALEHHYREKPRFFAFDSFEGLPESQAMDDHAYRPAHWARSKYAFSVDDFKKVLAKERIDRSDVHIVAGWYDRTLTEETKRGHDLTHAAMVYVDCDYYESTVPVLNFVTDLVQDGTVIVFDDYNFYRGSPDLGQRRAFSEWLGRNLHIKAIELARHDFNVVGFYLVVGGR